MGDNDTKNDAKRICLLEAKRLCLEKAGTYIESNVTVTNFQLTRDEIKTYSAAILKVDIVSEKIEFIGESVAIVMFVKAKVDIDYIKEKIKQIKSDKQLENKIKIQQYQLKELENKIKNLQRQLNTDDLNLIIQKRKARKEIFNQIDELEQIKYNINKITRLATENIDIAMTPEEVVKVAGKPRIIKKQYEYVDGCIYYNYGKVWVIFEGGIVSCIVKTEYFQLGQDCSYHKSVNSRSIIK